MIKYLFTYWFFSILLITVLACDEKNSETDAVARVNDRYLYEDDLNNILPENLSKEDSILYRNNYIKVWATKELLLDKARINIEDENNEIEALVQNYRKELLIDRYKKAVLQQELDTLLTEEDIDEYYESNKNVYRLNEKLLQLRYIYFSNELSDKKELIKLFRSANKEDMDELISRELEFYSFAFNDSIWVNYREVEQKLTFLKQEKNIKKNQYIQKEDSLGVYLLAIKNVRRRNEIAPKNYVTPSIKQMILHKRKLELMNEIEKTIVIDAIKNKQFEQY